jgi:predicted ATP-dependent Lon-type protease
MAGINVAFPATNNSHPHGGLMIEVEILRADNKVVCPETMPLLRCSESVTGIYDAFSAAFANGVADPLSYSFSFSRISRDKLNTRKNYVQGDSLSLAAFISICATTSKNRLSRSVAVTGAIHQSQGEFICAPIAKINQKLLLAEHAGFSRIYVPHRNFQEASCRSNNHLEIIPLPSELPKLIEIFMCKEGL